MSHSDEDRKIAAVLFGDPIKPIHVEVKGRFNPDLTELVAPLEWEHGILKMFCTSCGGYYELSRKGAHDFAVKGGFHLPEKLASRYIEVDGCESCDATLVVIKLESINS